MSTPEPHDGRLPERAEALLDGWPAPARGALEWEDAAARTMERVRETSIGSTPDALLEAPLGEEAEEGSLAAPSAPSVVDDEPPMLANIARAVVAAGAQAATKDVAREGLRAAEEERRSAPPPAPSRRGYEAASRTDEAPRSRPQFAAVQAMHEAPARSELPARDPGERRGGWGIMALGGGAALALAAGAALYVSVRGGEGRSVLAEASAEAPAASAVAAAPASLPTPAAPPKAEPSPRAIALDGLPGEPTKSRPGERATHGAASAPLSGASKDSLAFRVKSAPAGGGKLVLEERNDEPESPQATAVQAPNAASRAAKNAAGEEPGLPPQPSLGAVQAAVGSVMTGARSCLAGQDTGSKANVKFGKDGRVMAVAISGPAAGTPAESCVRSALMGARVPPFSEPSFAASLTIRPP